MNRGRPQRRWNVSRLFCRTIFFGRGGGPPLTHSRGGLAGQRGGQRGEVGNDGTQKRRSVFGFFVFRGGFSFRLEQFAEEWGGKKKEEQLSEKNEQGVTAAPPQGRGKKEQKKEKSALGGLYLFIVRGGEGGGVPGGKQPLTKAGVSDGLGELEGTKCGWEAHTGPGLGPGPPPQPGGGGAKPTHTPHPPQKKIKN